MNRARALVPLLRRLLRLPVPRHAAGPPDVPPERPEPRLELQQEPYWGQTMLDMEPVRPRPYVPRGGGR